MLLFCSYALRQLSLLSNEGIFTAPSPCPTTPIVRNNDVTPGSIAPLQNLLFSYVLAASSHVKVAMVVFLQNSYVIV